MFSPYSVNHKQKTKHFSTRDWNTPSVTFSEGMQPSGQFMPAPYLKLLREKGTEDTKVYTQVVVSTGKVLALDSNGFVVPAGILDSGDTYTEKDVEEGVIAADGTPAVAGDKVADKMRAANITVSAPIGVALFDFFRHPGGDGINPLQFNYQNLNYQARVTFLCDYVLELPIVESDTVYEKAPLKGISAFIAAKGPNAGQNTVADFTTIKPGDFVTFDKNSNFVVAQASDDSKKIIGQVLQVVKPSKENMLKWVRSSSAGGSELDKMPGTATNGLVDKISYSGGYGLVRVNLINR